MSVTNATLRENLRRLSEAVGVAGGEGEVRKLILELIGDRVEDVRIDPMGNVTALRRGTGRHPLRVMLTAHMDEAGFMVTGVNDNGLISVVEVGAHDERIVPAQRVFVGRDRTPGVFLWGPVHKTSDQTGLVKIKNMHIDVGADAKSGVKAKPGEYVAFMGAYAELSQDVVRGKAFGSRAGCAALIELVWGEPCPFDVHVVFTVQEEIGGRGAGVAANRVAPDVTVVLRGSECNDFPPDPADPTPDRAPIVRFGGGPALTILDPGLIADRRLVAHLTATAKAHSIPYQIDAQNILRSEGGTISVSKAGVPVAVVGIPVRYLRSPNALLHLDDVNNTIRLMRAALDALTPETLNRLGTPAKHVFRGEPR